MKIIRIKGGLGNQLFQYCFAKKIQHYFDEETYLDFSLYDLDNNRLPLLLNFNIDIPTATRREINQCCLFEHNAPLSSTRYKLEIIGESLFNSKYYFERDRRFQSIHQFDRYSYFDGYWQSYRYFDDIYNEKIKTTLSPKNKLSDATVRKINEIKTSKSVFVGIRRGDYLLVKPRHYGFFSNDYFIRAMQKIEEYVDNPVYYIFSDDVKYVKENMSFGNRNIILNEDGSSDYEDFLCMSNCKHSIIMNSTYHFWAARLNDTADKKVVAPQRWFFDSAKIDILPSHWLKCEV